MPTSRELQQQINQFNKKYASNFSIEGYEKQIIQARADAEAKKNGTLTDEADDLDFDLYSANENKEEVLVNENEKEQISVEIEEPKTEISQPIQSKEIDEVVVSKSAN